MTPLPTYQNNLAVSTDTGIKNNTSLKDRIIEYDREKEKLKLLRSSESSKNTNPYDKVGRDDENLLKMNQMSLYAKVQSIRDKQMDERKNIEKILKKKDEKIDLMVELERLKEMKRMEDNEKQTKLKLQEGKNVILKQIEENRILRKKERDLEEKERLALLKIIEEQNLAQKKKEQQRQEESEKLNNELKEANKQIIQSKKQKRLLELEEERKIEQYNKEKAKKEEELIQEQNRLKIEKEKELQKLREKQEKAQDNRALLDALRAKRAFEETENKKRQKEKEELLLKQKALKDLYIENAKQKQYRELQLAEEAQKEKEEFERIIKQNEKAIAEQKLMEKIKREKVLQNIADIRRQVAEKSEMEKISRREVIEEGRKSQMEYEEYLRNIEAIKKDKIQELKNMNVNDRYIVPLQKFKIRGMKSDS